MQTVYAIVLCLAVLLPSIAAQDGSIGTCSAQTVFYFVGSLPNGEACGQALVDVLYANQTTVSTDEYTTALTTLCQVDCAGKIAEWSAITCGNIDFATTLYFYCLPRDNSGDRCRSAAPDLVDPQLIVDLAQCTSFEDECPAGCAAALQRGVNLMGCCYQSVYNNTDVVEYFTTTGQLTTSDLTVINAIKRAELWNACNVTLTTFCGGDPFPGTSQLIVGNCSLAAFDDLDVSTECGVSLATVFTNPTDALLNTYCEESCINPHVRFVRQNCQDPFAANFSSTYCLDTMGELGNRCGQVLSSLSTNSQVFDTVGTACLATDSEDCSDACQDALQDIRDQLGCCYQNIYNNTLTLDIFFLEELITFEERYFFEVLGDRDLWEDCEVPLIPYCEAVEDGGVKLVASTIMMLSVAALSIFL